MGMSFMKSCSTNSEISTAPNPSPSRYTVLRWYKASGAYVLLVKYHDCTNFEGHKIMVYEGSYAGNRGGPLDPHFAETGHAPIARFAPTVYGWELACDFARRLG